MAYTLCTITVDELNIRAQPTSQSALVATYPRGTVLNFVEVVNGENVDGNPRWGHSEQGHYYWLGGTNYPNGPDGNPTVPAMITLTRTPLLVPQTTGSFFAGSVLHL